MNAGQVFNNRQDDLEQTPTNSLVNQLILESTAVDAGSVLCELKHPKNCAELDTLTSEIRTKRANTLRLIDLLTQLNSSEFKHVSNVEKAGLEIKNSLKSLNPMRSLDKLGAAYFDDVWFEEYWETNSARPLSGMVGGLTGLFLAGAVVGPRVLETLSAAPPIARFGLAILAGAASIVCGLLPLALGHWIARTTWDGARALAKLLKAPFDFVKAFDKDNDPLVHEAQLEIKALSEPSLEIEERDQIFKKRLCGLTRQVEIYDQTLAELKKTSISRFGRSSAPTTPGEVEAAAASQEVPIIVSAEALLETLAKSPDSEQLVTALLRWLDQYARELQAGNAVAVVNPDPAVAAFNGRLLSILKQPAIARIEALADLKRELLALQEAQRSFS